MIGLCMGLAGVVWAQLPLSHFTLAWTHTIEKIRWEEDYLVLEQGLLLGEARIRGAGAGMEIPPDALLQNGSWHYHRQLPPLQPLKLARTPEAGDFQLCFHQKCHLMSEWVGAPNRRYASIELWPCK